MSDLCGLRWNCCGAPCARPLNHRGKCLCAVELNYQNYGAEVLDDLLGDRARRAGALLDDLEMCKVVEKVLREHRSPFDDGTVPTLTFPTDAKALATAVVCGLIFDGWKIERRKQ